jgi:hypothetical protein
MMNGAWWPLTSRVQDALDAVTLAHEPALRRRITPLRPHNINGHDCLE